MKATILLFICSAVSIFHAAYGSMPARDPSCAALLPSYLADLDSGRSPKPLPIPVGSRPPIIRDVGYNIEEVRPGVYTVHDSVYFSMIVLKDRHLVLIDAPDPVIGTPSGPSNTTVTASAAIEILNGSRPLKIDMVYSHSHFDHIGTATSTKNILENKYPGVRFKIWASKGTLRSLLESNSDRAPLPNRIFDNQATLKVGRRGGSMPILLKRIGGHTEDDILVYFSPHAGQKGVAFTVDLIFPGWAPAFYLAVTQNVNQYLAVHDMLMKFDFDIFIGGHVTKTGTKKDIAINKKYVLAVIEAARNALSDVSPFPEIAQQLGLNDPKSRGFGNLFLGAGTFFKNVEVACARSVIEEWGCRVGGVESVAETECVTARFYIAIDI